MRRELAFLVMDELHVYRGRQGADVAMPLRRVRHDQASLPSRRRVAPTSNVSPESALSRPA